jgi:imidazolonepropionase-like amidohydrolase
VDVALLRAEGRIGVLAAGALADVLLVEGDPTAGIGMWTEPQRGIRLIMKAGRVLRDRLAASEPRVTSRS